MAEPTGLEQYLLELINRARLDPAGEAARFGIGLNDGLTAGTISTTAKAPLAFNPLLIDAARGHSDWILATDTFSHTGAGGSSPGDRMTAAGYVFSGSWTWGENIALRSGALSSTTVELLHEQLFESAGHRANLLNVNFRETGLGLAQGEYRGFTASVVTEVFARSGSNVFLTGVAFDDRDGDRFYDPGEGLGGVTLTIRNTATGAVTTATSWSAGGYSVALGAGSYEVTFSGGALPAPTTKAVTIGSSNVKLDLDADAGAPAGLALTGTAANEVLTGGLGADRLLGLAGADTLLGGSSGDTLEGGAGRDVLDGGAGDDRLVGGGSPDRATGGGGADRFVFQNVSTDRGDLITDFTPAEGDRVDIAGLLAAGAGTGWAALSASGHARLTQTSAGAVLWVDPDGGGDGWLQVTTFGGRSVAQLGGDFLLG
ncbi:CAP domain-containing protein [Falsiroseomonas oryzae]|uniref:CAP domain-containing protein n=1 Tax=Falsiroseomonas oryzae TaxID=2766473 RepID=UPI0022EBA2DF|nr:CAP domain-containing protein [Roseomonas sp. MO-31]